MMRPKRLCGSSWRTICCQSESMQSDGSGLSGLWLILHPEQENSTMTALVDFFTEHAPSPQLYSYCSNPSCYWWFSLWLLCSVPAPDTLPYALHPAPAPHFLYTPRTCDRMDSLSCTVLPMPYYAVPCPINTLPPYVPCL
jgi:hypothetical protein